MQLVELAKEIKLTNQSDDFSTVAPHGNAFMRCELDI